MFLDFILLTISFIALWVGAGYSVLSVEKISLSSKISSFIISFFILGFFTSLSEISVAVFSVINKTPQVSVGNLIGASTILTLLVIPSLFFIDKKLKFEKNSKSINLPISYFLISLPVFLIFDKVLNYTDAILIISLFIILLLTTSYNKPFGKNIVSFLHIKKVEFLKEISKIFLGVSLIILSSNYIVDASIELAKLYNVPPFFIGLFIISIGTNLPELSILFRSFFMRKKAVALGDYIGSSVVNSVTLAFLILINPNPIVFDNEIKLNLFLLPLGSILLLIFIKDRKINKFESFSLLFLFIIFIAYEFYYNK